MSFELIVVLGVVVLGLAYGAYRFAKANPNNSVVQQAEAKLPPVVQTALGVDHVGVVTAALQGAAQVVAAANPPPVAAPAAAPVAAPVAPPASVPAEALARVPADQGQRQMLAGILGSEPKAPAPVAPAAPVQSAFDPVLWGKAEGNIFNNGNVPFSAPVFFETTIAASAPNTDYYVTNGVTDPTMSTPSVTDEAGNVLCSGYGDNHAFVLPADTKVKVTVTPNKIPAGCSIELARGSHRSATGAPVSWNLPSGRHA